MAPIKEPKAQIAAGIGTITASLVWPWLKSVEQFQVLFQGNSAQGFIGTLFISIMLAGVAAGAIYALLSAIEQALE